METDPVVVFRCYSDAEAAVVRALLQSYGIPCSLGSDITHFAYPLTIDGLGEVRLAVPASVAEDARAIIEAHREGPGIRLSLVEASTGGKQGEGQGS